MSKQPTDEWEDALPGELDDGDDPLATYEEVIRRFGTATETPLREMVATALLKRGMFLDRLLDGGDSAGDLEEWDLEEGNPEEEALASYDEVIRRFGEAPETSLRQHVARALLKKGHRLWHGCDDQAILACYDELVRRFGEDSDSVLRQQVARALAHKQGLLRQMGRLEEALACGDERVRRFGEDPEPSFRQMAAQALVEKQNLLRKEGRTEEALACDDELVRRFGEDPEPSLLKQVARTLFERGERLSRMDRHEDALASFNQLVRRFGDASESHLREWVARALSSKGTLLSKMGRREDALASFKEIIRRFGESPETPLRRHAEMARSTLGEASHPGKASQGLPREQAAGSLVDQGRTFLLGNQSAQAIACFDEVLRQFGHSSEDMNLRQQVSESLVRKGMALAQLGRPREALDSFHEVIRRFDFGYELPSQSHPFPNPRLCLLVAEAFIQKGLLLAQHGHPQEAVASVDEVIRRFGDVVEAPLREHLASPSTHVGSLFRHQAQSTRDFQDSRAPLRLRVSDLLRSSGFWELGEAKRRFQQGQAGAASMLLSSAKDRLEAAAKLEPEDSTRCNTGYIAFLQGRRDEARSILSEVLGRRGEVLPEAWLTGVKVHPLPQDEEFRALLHELSDGRAVH